MELGLFDRELCDRLAEHEGWSRLERETWNTWLAHAFGDQEPGLEPFLVSADGSLDAVHAVRAGDALEPVAATETTPILAALMRLALGLVSNPHRVPVNG
jgi:hypothetical protein